MPITVPSPHSGRPVKVRDQDVGRAVRDEDGRIFYVLPSRDGEGHYGALTRSGEPKQEKRAAELAKTTSRPQAEVGAPAVPHDATGTPRRGGRGVLVAMAGVLILAALAYLFVWGPGRDWLVRPQPSGGPVEKVVPESPGASQTPLPLGFFQRHCRARRAPVRWRHLPPTEGTACWSIGVLEYSTAEPVPQYSITPVLQYSRPSTVGLWPGRG